VASLGFRAGTQLKLLQQQNLPFPNHRRQPCVHQPGAAAQPTLCAGQPPLHLQRRGDISLAAPDADHPTVPRLFGAVNNVQVTLPDGFSGAPHFSINTFSLALENLTIGDMAGLSGGVTVGNLNNPSELFFAGEAGVSTTAWHKSHYCLARRRVDRRLSLGGPWSGGYPAGWRHARRHPTHRRGRWVSC